jgi:hypothetical protein
MQHLLKEFMTERLLWTLLLEAAARGNDTIVELLTAR